MSSLRHSLTAVRSSQLRCVASTDRNNIDIDTLHSTPSSARLSASKFYEGRAFFWSHSNPSLSRFSASQAANSFDTESSIIPESQSSALFVSHYLCRVSVLLISRHPPPPPHLSTVAFSVAFRSAQISRTDQISLRVFRSILRRSFMLRTQTFRATSKSLGVCA